MSKGRRDTGGAFDALVHAIVGLGAVPSWAQLPPATASGTLGRALGQGVLHGRLPQGMCPADALPLRAAQMRHEGQRSVAELGTLLWHAMGGPHGAPELEPWMAPPHTDPIVALTLSRKRLAEYAVPEAIDRRFAFPGNRVWLIEIERAKGDVPGGIAVWRSPGTDGEWRTRCACVWTCGRIGSTTHPLVMGAQWRADGREAVGDACVIGPSWDVATRAAKDASDASRVAVLARRRDAIGPQMMARIATPAALAWLDQHGGTARPAGRFGAGERAHCGRRPRTVHPVRALGRPPAPAWLAAAPERAVEAIVLRTAGEGWRVGASCPVPEWRDGWAGYAEMGAVAWHAVADLRGPIDSGTWTAMERALREDGLAARSAHPALETTSALVRKMLVQTGRNHVARAPDARTLCALEIPTRLWRALGEAGPCPEPPAPLDLTERWWLVEIEHQGDDEPNALALWEEDGAEVALAAFLDVDEAGRTPLVTMVTWRTAPDGARGRAGVAVLKYPVHVDDPASPEAQAGTKLVVDTLAAPDSGSVARAKTAIALHLAHDGEAAALGPYRASTAGAWSPRQGVAARRRSFTALFALKRAPEPERGEDHATGPGGHRRGGGGPLRARQEVAPHWKRQAYGPRRSRRRWIVIERYERGPAPDDDQIVVTRLAERQRPGGDDTGERP